MKAFLTAVACTTLTLGLPWADAAMGPAGQWMPFGMAAVRFEQNATDGDAEVVFEVRGGDDGLAWLRIVGPDGRTVVEMKAPDPSTLGVRQLQIESPEPPDPDVVKAAYPEGAYTISGGTAAGDSLRSRVTLSHSLPGPVVVLQPGDGAEGVPIAGLRIAWTPVDDAVAYLVTIEDEETGGAFSMTLGQGSDGLWVPDDFLEPGREYQLAIGTIAENGNASFVETGFFTAEGN
jgi:hypothetical protein